MLSVLVELIGACRRVGARIQIRFACAFERFLDALIVACRSALNSCIQQQKVVYCSHSRFWLMNYLLWDADQSQRFKYRTLQSSFELIRTEMEPETLKTTQAASNSESKQNNPNAEEGLLDFSAMFKKGTVRPPPKLTEKAPKAQTPNWLLEIPAKLDISKEQLEQRRYINMERWTQVVRSSGEDELFAICLSAFNFLFKANISLSQFLNSCTDEVEAIRKHSSRRERVRLILDSLQKVHKPENLKVKLLEGEAVSDAFLKEYRQGITKSDRAYIYLSYGRALLPIGFENTPLVPLDAYLKESHIKPENLQMWIINSSCAPQERTFMIKRWEHIKTDTRCKFPEYIDLEETKKGVQKLQDTELNKEQYEESCWIELSID